MPIQFPVALRPGDRVGVTSPSSGVAARHRARLNFAVECVRARGYDVVMGACMDGASHVSAPAAERAAELTAMLTEPSIRAVVPPWGGETAIDLLPLLDWEAIAAAAPTWFVGFSDISTLITPLTLRTAVATVHGNNLMDTPYGVPSDLATWLDIVALPAGASFTQSSPGMHRAGAWDDYAASPHVTDLTLEGKGNWVRLDGEGPVDVTGRLIGGCIETLGPISGTPFCDVARFAADHVPEGLIVYVEAAEHDAFTICRHLHGMRLAGFFTGANAILVGRTTAPDGDTLTQKQAVLDALGGLAVPIIGDIECGHVPPYLPILNGALARLRLTGGTGSLTQTLA
jgi:muramoyltetrapeptide carboxypeptidase LdcA involved in peptidoglycan recycling